MLVLDLRLEKFLQRPYRKDVCKIAMDDTKKFVLCIHKLLIHKDCMKWI